MSYGAFKPDIGWFVYELLKLVIWTIAAGFLFFGSPYGMLVAAPSVLLIYRRDRRALVRRKKDGLRLEFKDMLAALAGNLHAGYSLENAFIHSEEDMRKLHGEESMIVREQRGMISAMKYNCRLEELLLDFGRRSGIEEIEECAKLIVSAKVHGGKMLYVMGRISRNMNERFAVEQEIQVVIAAKRLEGRIMLIAPFAIILYMRLTNGEYMNVLYTTAFGRCIMLAGFLALIFSGWLIDKITGIEV